MLKTINTIGRQDKIDLPDFGLYDIDAKVDTGAYTSAINCSKVKLKTVNGVSTLSFSLTGMQLHEKKARRFSTTQFKVKRIKSSNGMIEERFVIFSKVILFKRRIKTEFSLSNRSNMKFPILLGRKLLRKGFIIDVHQKNLSYSKKKKK